MSFRVQILALLLLAATAQAATPDFHLRPDSPAIDAGAPIPSVTTDFDGVKRPQGKGYDIGAYEFVQPAPASAPAPVPALSMSAKIAPEHRKLVREHTVWYRHFPARIDEVWITFAPKKKQMGRIIYSHGVLPPTISLVTIAELEICAAIKSQEMPHDSIKYPLAYKVYQLSAATGTLRPKNVPVTSGALLSCP